MSRPMGRPPKPLEEKLRLGNPGKRPLPDRAKLVALPAADGPPEPMRPLGPAGQAMWDRIWTAGAVWLARNIDAETILIICEQMDERHNLRFKVLKEGNRLDRVGLRALDAQIQEGLSMIGFNPVDRGRLGVAEVRAQTKLEELMAKRAARSS